MTEAIGPGGVVGILGGGQLGRMLAIAAAQLGLKAHIYCPDANPPAGDVSAAVSIGSYDDAVRLEAFARSVDVVTYEFENVPAATVEAIAPFAPVRPGARALAVAQDRLAEKDFLTGVGLGVAPYAAVDDAESLAVALDEIGLPAILKTRRFGYDGKGQARIMSRADAQGALEDIAGAPAILEGFVAFRRELSVVAARGIDGAIRAFDAAENVHEGGILRTSAVPAAGSEGAAKIAEKILNALDYVGVIGVELFECEDGALLVNEIAPRVHNTGHWTIEACATDQFQQHIRAVCGWPLAPSDRHADAVMTNLIGDEADEWGKLAERPGAAIHLYGKGEARPGRKMGHVTQTTPMRDVSGR